MLENIRKILKIMSILQMKFFTFLSQIDRWGEILLVTSGGGGEITGLGGQFLCVEKYRALNSRLIKLRYIKLTSHKINAYKVNVKS